MKSEARKDVDAFLSLVAHHLTDSEAGPKARAARMASRYEPSDKGLAPLIVRARECPVAWDACVTLFDQLIQTDAPIPDNLLLMARDAMAGTATKPKKRGRDGMKSWSRDAVIINAIGIAAEHGLPLYANGYENKRTACSMVSESLVGHGVHLSPDAVVSILQQRNGGKK